MSAIVLQIAALAGALALMCVQLASEAIAIEHGDASPLAFEMMYCAIVAILLYLTVWFTRSYFAKWGLPAMFSPASLEMSDCYKADVLPGTDHGLADKAAVLEAEKAGGDCLLGMCRPDGDIRSSVRRVDG